MLDINPRMSKQKIDSMYFYQLLFNFIRKYFTLDTIKTFYNEMSNRQDVLTFKNKIALQPITHN